MLKTSNIIFRAILIVVLVIVYFVGIHVAWLTLPMSLLIKFYPISEEKAIEIASSQPDIIQMYELFDDVKIKVILKTRCGVSPLCDPSSSSAYNVRTSSNNYWVVSFVGTADAPLASRFARSHTIHTKTGKLFSPFGTFDPQARLGGRLTHYELGQPITIIEALPPHISTYELRDDTVQIKGSELAVRVLYSGGCLKHTFTAHASSIASESPVTQISMRIIHDDHEDTCSLPLISYLEFDLSDLQSLVNNHPAILNINFFDQTKILFFKDGMWHLYEAKP